MIELSFGALRSDAARDAATALSIFRPKPNAFAATSRSPWGRPTDLTLETSATSG